MRAASSTVLMSGQTAVNLWGAEEIVSASPTFKLKARTALANIIAGEKVECEVKSRSAEGVWAQCVNGNDMDLSLFMIQQGYVTVDRGAVYGSVFEEVYVQAEKEAQERVLGVWGAAAASDGGSAASSDGSLMMSLGFILFIFIVAAFAVLSIIIMRGFKQVIDAQKSSLNILEKERQLKNKERSIVATMFDSELKANKSKIEAYLVVYEETLAALRDPERTPKYKKAGDIVQLQPALNRGIFDRNTNRLDILGRKLSSALIHFYARIKTNPDYENLEPTTPLEEAVQVLEKAVKSAQRLNRLADDLINGFEESGVTEERNPALEDEEF